VRESRNSAANSKVGILHALGEAGFVVTVGSVVLPAICVFFGNGLVASDLAGRQIINVLLAWARHGCSERLRTEQKRFARVSIVLGDAVIACLNSRSRWAAMCSCTVVACHRSPLALALMLGDASNG